MNTKDEEAKDNPVLVALNEESNRKYVRAAGMQGISTEGIQEQLGKDN